MMLRSFICGVLLSYASFALAAGPGRDHPLVGRYAGSIQVKYEQLAADQVRLLNKAIDFKTHGDKLVDGNSLTVLGKTTRLRYEVSGRSALEVAINYREGLKAKGFETLFACEKEACTSGDTGFYQLGGLLDDARRNGRYADALSYTLAKLARPQGDVYVALLVGTGLGKTTSAITVVEVAPVLTGQIQFVGASQMEAALAASGKVVLYGILFDTGKYDIKPESQRTLQEMAKLMLAQSGKQFVVTGHTDNQGEFTANVELSQRRAAAVRDALVKLQVPAARLQAFGAGMAAPVAENETDAGRAKNRRVELVRR